MSIEILAEVLFTFACHMSCMTQCQLEIDVRILLSQMLRAESGDNAYMIKACQVLFEPARIWQAYTCAVTCRCISIGFHAGHGKRIQALKGWHAC